MAEADLRIRCQRCGAQMTMRDPAPGAAWAPDQFWVCPQCGRHFWTTYPPPKKDEPKPAGEAKPAAEPRAATAPTAG
jgi:hypothetical protein